MESEKLKKQLRPPKSSHSKSKIVNLLLHSQTNYELINYIGKGSFG